MKSYTFIHKYIYGPQVGIQAAHSIVELMLYNEVKDWASNHKTFVWLDGGDSTHMDKLLGLIHLSDFKYGVFREPSMSNLVTAITVVIPSEYVSIIDDVREVGSTALIGTDFDIRNILLECAHSRTKKV